MSTLKATNIKSPDSINNNLVLDAGGGVVISGVTTVTTLDATEITGISGGMVVSGVTTVSAGSTSAPSITPSGDSNTGIFFPSADTIAFGEGGSEVARFDSSGRLLVGTSSQPLFGANRATFVGANTSTIGLGNLSVFTSDLQAADLGGSISLGGVYADPGGQYPFGSIAGRKANSTDANAEGYLQFSTTDSGNTLTERMRIQSDGQTLIGNTTASSSDTGIIFNPVGLGFFVRNGGTTFVLNRLTDDGTLAEFRQDNTAEGTISVSGTAVSYNGAHLSRWSQLPNGATREEILRGTVLSNIDEMCEWGDEDNEQLNRMKVSDVEGDPNVSGVFQSWDDDDDTYTDDFYCAMTGDFIIRIAEDVTVQRGDLLMSAGDGTAKPQEDDIVRSKTVAKVTSTHVTCTYEDGSYCVPCVLMAC